MKGATSLVFLAAVSLAPAQPPGPGEAPAVRLSLDAAPKFSDLADAGLELARTAVSPFWGARYRVAWRSSSSWNTAIRRISD